MGVYKQEDSCCVRCLSAISLGWADPACQPSPAVPDIHPPCPLDFLSGKHSTGSETLILWVSGHGGGRGMALTAPELGKVSSPKAESAPAFPFHGAVRSKGLHFPASLGQGRPRGAVLTNGVRAKKQTSALSRGLDHGLQKQAFLEWHPQPCRHASPRLGLTRKRDPRLS